MKTYNMNQLDTIHTLFDIQMGLWYDWYVENKSFHKEKADRLGMDDRSYFQMKMANRFFKLPLVEVEKILDELSVVVVMDKLLELEDNLCD